MRQAAIVTGASSGIGRAVSETLCELDYEVFGFGRNFDLCKLKKDNFHPIICNLLDTAKLEHEIKRIAGEWDVHVLINNAGVAYYGLHEELNAKKIAEMVRTNLEVPMILSAQLLRTLKKNKGHIIDIASVTAFGSNPHGCAYGATKAGQLSFGRSLFDEARKYGVRVTTICPDMTKTELYRNADFREAEEEEARLVPEDVADAVAFVLNAREGMVLSELTLKPQLHRIRKKPLAK